MVVDVIAVRAGLIEQAALWGGLQANDPGGEAGFAKAIDLMPDSGLAKAGVREGDLVRFERSYERLRRGSIGEKLNFTLDHDGVRTNRQLTVEPIQWNEAEEQRNFRGLLNALASLVTMLIGCFILWRGWGNKTAMLLGAALLAQGLNIIALPPWAGTPILAIPMWSLVMVAAVLGALQIPFAMRMYEENVGPLPRRHWQGMKVFLILATLQYFVFGWNYFTVTNRSGLVRRHHRPLWLWSRSSFWPVLPI